MQRPQKTVSCLACFRVTYPGHEAGVCRAAEAAGAGLWQRQSKQQLHFQFRLTLLFPVTRATRRASAVRQKRQRHVSGSGTDSLQQPSPLSGQSSQRFFAECCLIFCLRQPSCPAQGPAMHGWTGYPRVPAVCGAEVCMHVSAVMSATSRPAWTLWGRRLDGIEGKPLLHISCWPKLPVPCHGFVFVSKPHRSAGSGCSP